MTIDLNADAGESYGVWSLGDDEALFPHLTSVNLACGFHAGDPKTIERSVRLALQHRLAIGAHPSFPDRVGFGRRELQASEEEIRADVLYQIGALSAFLKAHGARLHHVKAHGALYNQATREPSTARALAEAVHAFDPKLPLVVLPGTPLEEEARALGLPVLREGFPERGYLADGRLAPRHLPGAIIEDPDLAAQRALAMVRGKIQSLDGGELPVQIETLCVHGDHPRAPAVARAIRAILEAHGIAVQAA
jgi:UPF0271 protein